MKKKGILILAIFLILVVGIVIVEKVNSGSIEKPVSQTSIFSWSAELVSDKQGWDSLEHAVDQLKIGRIFQAFPERPDHVATGKFVARFAEEDRLCYGLLGKPEWAKEEGLAEAKSRIAAFASYNGQAENQEKLAGVVLDIEPYLLDGWDQDQKAVLSGFLKNIKELYRFAKERDLYTIVCVPYWYDNDYANILESLITDACDELAVMNYYVGEEYDHIEAELEFCKKTDKPIVSITEFQKPGHHDLTDEITYYNRGLSAAQDMFAHLKEEAQYEKLSFSYHYLDPIETLLRRNGA